MKTLNTQPKQVIEKSIETSLEPSVIHTQSPCV